MKKILTKRLGIALGICAALLISCLCLALFPMHSLASKAEITFPEGEELKDTYTVGESLRIPTGTIESAGQSYTADSHILYYPSGVTTVANTVLLDEEGLYKLEYHAASGIKEDVTFLALQPLVSVSGNGSARLGYYGDEEADYENADKDGNLKYPDAAGIEGIRLTMSENAVFTYNKLIDLSDMTVDDTLLDYIMLPTVKGVADLYEIQVTFTDAYDPDNQLTVKYQEVTPSSESWTWCLTYVQAKGAGQQFTGIENEEISIGGDYGASGYFAFNGNGRQPVGKEFMRLHYDSKELKLYHSSSRGKVLICDFDDSRFFGTNTWDGFTTGEVFMSLQGARYTGSSANILIRDIYGQDLSADAQTLVAVDTAPNIVVDTEGYAKNALPKAVVNQEYPVFDYTVTDPYGVSMDSEVKVYYGYGSSSQVEMNISDGVFVPNRVGLYVFEYSAVNVYGKRAVQTCMVWCEKEIPVSISLSNDKVTAGTAGREIGIAEVTGYTGSGNVAIETFIEFGNERVSVTDNAFIPEAEGKYRVVYVGTDFLGQNTEESYIVSVTAEDEPIAEANLPKFFVAGYTYELPVVTAYNYKTGSEIPTTISVTGGTITGNLFKANEDVKEAVISYMANGKEAYKQTVPVIDGTRKYQSDFDEDLWLDGIDIPAYFSLTNMTSEAASSNIRFTSSGSGDAGFIFVNPIYADGFTVVFNVPSVNAAFEKIEIVLEDSLDAAVRLIIGLRPMDDGTTSLEINGKSTGNRLTASVTAGRETYITYSAENNTVSDHNALTQLVEGFGGFPSGKVYFSMKFVGNTANSTVIVSQINGQNMNNANLDNAEPKVTLMDKLPILLKSGEEVTVARAIGTDIFDPYVTGYVTVQKIGEGYVTTKDGITLSPQTKASFSNNYSFIADDYGNYRVSYVVEDSYGQKVEYSRNLRVIDSEAPAITVSGDVPKNGTVGQSISLPSATATDNVSEVSVSVIVIDPNSHFINLGTATSFTPDISGRYIIRYVSADGEGNMSVLDYTIEVK